MEWLSLLLFISIIAILLLGVPVSLALAGTSLIFAVIGIFLGEFEASFLTGLPNRIYGIMTNPTLLAIPLFVFMGITLEKSKIAENLLESLSVLFSGIRGGLAIAVTLIGMLLAASTGIVGATVVTMGLLALPTMQKNNYSTELSTGIICASGTLGQIIPPSIVLVMLGDVISSSYQYTQMNLGNYSPRTVSVGDLFAGALIPGVILVLFYISYILLISYIDPKSAPKNKESDIGPENPKKIISSLLPPLGLMVLVLGSILLGMASPTEAAGIGAFGALIISYTRKTLNKKIVLEISNSTLKITGMVFFILISASVFSLVFRGFSGDELVHNFLTGLPGDKVSAMIITMIVIFILGFILDFIEITFVVIPIVAPILLGMGFDPVWLGIMIAINLQTSFLTPPFGFALFYLRGVAPDTVKTQQIYKGIIPFVLIQIIMLVILSIYPEIITFLPDYIYSN
ncbi:MAG: TRAP transporter large permease subunit [Woeseiaceae bacterium]|tara:strand:- start:250 stop:1623 length:1374 start_codon:yes stop_codon:yes gene_type:complete